MKTKKLPTFTINRLLWHRGKEKYGSRLLVPETGKMCCLGQIACQLGYSKEEISGVTAPNNLEKKDGFMSIGCLVEKQPFTDTADFTSGMMGVNDRTNMKRHKA